MSDKIVKKRLNIPEMIGKTYGKLTIIEKCGQDKYGVVMLKCECSCGNSTVTRASYIWRGKTDRCHTCPRHITHGNRKHPLYIVWANMKQRTTNPKVKCFPNYGGRGIIMCDDWLKSFENFFEWANNSGWKKSMQIDRIDNDQGYFPENCRWVTPLDNSRNRRVTKMVEFNGSNIPLAKFCEDHQLDYEVVSRKVNAGWNTKTILETLKQ